MNKEKAFNVISLIINILIAIFTFGSIIYCFIAPKINGVEVSPWFFFIFYTIDSNLLVGISSVVLIPFNIFIYRETRENIPLWALIFKFISTVSVSVTFLTVVLFLGPISGNFLMLFEGSQIFLHAITPITAFISLVLFDDLSTFISFKYALFGISTVIIYGIIYFFNVVIFEVWQDFYHFYNNSIIQLIISVFLMIIGVFLISSGEYFLRKKLTNILFSKIKKENENMEIIDNKLKEEEEE